MSDIELRVRINPRTGKAVVVGQSGGGGSASSSGSSEGSASRAPSAHELAREMAMAMRQSGAGASGPGGGQLPWWLGGGLLGSAAASSVSSLLDPRMSGAQQQATLASQGARATSYATTKAGLTASAMAATGGASALSPAAEANIERISEAVGNAIGAAVEKAMERRTQTQAAATSTVQGVAARYAAAGQSDLLDDSTIKRLLARETSRQERMYDAQTRVAALSGNVSANAVGDAQKGIGNMFDDLANTLGVGIDKNAMEATRQQVMQQARGNRVLQGFNR